MGNTYFGGERKENIMIISANGYHDYELTFLKHPMDHQNEQMILDLARNFVKHIRSVDEAAFLKIGEYHCGRQEYTWQITLAAISSTTLQPLLEPIAGCEIFCTESSQYYEASSPTNRRENYTGIIEIDIAMYTDEADDNPNKMVENSYAQMLLSTAYSAYYKAIANWYTNWETRYLDSPKSLPCYRIDKI